MKHLAAYALLVLGGKENPSEKEVEKVITDAGSKPDSEKVKALCAALKDKKFHELVAAGSATLGAADQVRVLVLRRPVRVVGAPIQAQDTASEIMLQAILAPQNLWLAGSVPQWDKSFTKTKLSMMQAIAESRDRKA